ASKIQCYYLYNNEKSSLDFNEDFSNDNISDYAKNHFGLDNEEIFYYVYAILHNSEYIDKFENDLKKDTPRIPLVSKKYTYVEIGKKLVDLHTNYERVNQFKDIKVVYKKDEPSFKVEKMKFLKIRNSNNKLIDDKSTIIF